MKKGLMVFATTILVIILLITGFYKFFQEESKDRVELIEDGKNGNTSEEEDKDSGENPINDIDFEIQPSTTESDDSGRVYEIIYFEISDRSLTENEIKWNFGDGKSDVGYSVLNIYDNSNVFTVKVKYHEKEVEKTISIYNQDYSYMSGSDEPAFAIRENKSTSIGGGYEIITGVSTPQISYSIDISQVNGNLLINIYIKSGDGDITTLYNETYYLEHEEFIFQETFNSISVSESLPNMFKYRISLSEGYRSSWNSTTSFSYMY